VQGLQTFSSALFTFLMHHIVCAPRLAEDKKQRERGVAESRDKDRRWSKNIQATTAAAVLENLLKSYLISLSDGIIWCSFTRQCRGNGCGDIWSDECYADDLLLLYKSAEKYKYKFATFLI
jgi:hypothetical protein